MKKTALLLAILLLFPLAAACNGDTGTESAVSEDSAAESESPPREEITHATIVSTGKSYTVSDKAGDAYPDSMGKELTDGARVEGDTVSYTDARFSGYSNAASINVIIDMDEDGLKLYRFEVSYLMSSSVGIGAISGAVISVSDDGNEWKRAGSAKLAQPADGSVHTAYLELDQTVDARYVRFTISRGGAWIFLDELTVIANVEGAEAVLLTPLVEAAYANDTLTAQQRAEQFAKVAANAPDRTLPKALVSHGKSYTLSRGAAASGHTDDGTKLTDGADTGMPYENAGWVSFEGGKAVDIIIDLGDVRTDLAAFELYMFSRVDTGIMLPAYTDIFVSENGTDYYVIGRMYASLSVGGNNYTLSLGLSTAVKGRYVKFSLAQTEGASFLIEEAGVYAYTTEEIYTETPLYPEVSLPEVGEEYWPSGSSGYNKEINLVAGLPFQIESGIKLSVEKNGQSNLQPSEMLTDGVKSTTASYYGGGWFRTNAGASRSIYFDLGKISSVKKFGINFLKYKSDGVNLPGVVTLYASLDGKSWYAVKTVSPEDVEAANATVYIEGALSKPVKARFVKIVYNVNVHTFLDEIEIFGTKSVSGAKLPSELGAAEEVTGSMLAPSADILGGVKDVMLAYHNSDSAPLTKEVFDSYTGYTDRQGRVIDTMFDGFLFLPHTGKLPSGGTAHSGSVKSEWDYVLGSVFSEGKNLDALNESVASLKSALGMPDYKVKVYYALLYASDKVTEFGDVDGDGVSENLSLASDREKALKWYASEFLSRFEAAGYENLEFHGFYWFHETINNNENELTTLNIAADVVHDLGYQFFWIPYYDASGYYQWSVYGFDAVCLQPNYAFNENAKKSRIKDTAELIRKFNLCIEIEINSMALSNDMYYERYMEYLKGGVYYGYMTGSIHMYYQGVYDFYTASKSKSDKVRKIYDYTYQFIKGTLDIYPDAGEDIAVTAQKDTVYTGKLFEPNDALKARVSITASNGSITVNPDGSFSYYPHKGFTGTDTFTYKISEGLDWSEDATVTVTVG